MLLNTASKLVPSMTGLYLRPFHNAMEPPSVAYPIEITEEADPQNCRKKNFSCLLLEQNWKTKSIKCAKEDERLNVLCVVQCGFQKPHWPWLNAWS